MRICGSCGVIFAVLAATARAAPPSLAFAQTPHNPTNQTSAMFAWTGTGPFTCSIDGSAFQSCTSPHDVSGLSEGAHEFRVQEPGALPITITDDWTVDLTPPTTLI